MIVRKDWITGGGNTRQVHRGWFLFGFIPLYIVSSAKGF